MVPRGKLMSATLPTRSPAQPPFERLTVTQYDQMIAAGIIPEGSPVELIDGFLIRKDRAEAGKDIMSVGNRHRSTVQLIERWLMNLLINQGFHCTTQQPIQLPPYDEPEPDLAVIRGRIEDYFDRKPGPGDVALVIEVADSSLSFDRDDKKKRYALAGIEHYWVVDLVHRQIECYSGPQRGDYPPPSFKLLDERISLPAELAGLGETEVNTLLAP